MASGATGGRALLGMYAGQTVVKIKKIATTQCPRALLLRLRMRHYRSADATTP